MLLAEQDEMPTLVAEVLIELFESEETEDWQRSIIEAASVELGESDIFDATEEREESCTIAGASMIGSEGGRLLL